jgi:SAM-dependent methyltransferase
MSSLEDDVASLRGRIEQLTTGYTLSAVLFAAADLRLFDHLSEAPASPEELAARLGAPVTGALRLCTALTALGFLQRAPDGRFALIPGARDLLTSEGDGSLLPVILHHGRQLAPLMMRLPEAVRTARPQHAAWSFASPGAAERHCYDELAQNPAEYELFLEAMDRGSAGVGGDIARAFDLRGVARLIDLGGGSGRVARELLAAAPNLTVEMLDLPVACRLAEKKARAAGLADRFHATAADFRRPSLDLAGGPADVVLLSGILADFSADDCEAILANAARLLRPGGALLVSETLLEEHRTGPLVPALLSLLMLAAMPGDSFTLSEITALLARGGFQVERHAPPSAPGRRDLIVARR